MIIADVEQGTDEWLQARLGIPTASMFSKIITPAGKASSSSKGYMNQLLAEWVTGEGETFTTNKWMERGNELEPQARSAYEFYRDANVEEVGLVYLNDTKLVAVSPDGLCKETNSGLEIKCPAPHTHVETLLANKMPTQHIPQVQGNIWVCDADYWDFMSYHETMEPLIVRIDRDDEYIEKMSAAFKVFLDEMLDKRSQLVSISAAA